MNIFGEDTRMTCELHLLLYSVPACRAAPPARAPVGPRTALRSLRWAHFPREGRVFVAAEPDPPLRRQAGSARPATVRHTPSPSHSWPVAHLVAISAGRLRSLVLFCRLARLWVDILLLPFPCRLKFCF